MVTRLEAQKSLTAEFAEAAKDDRYLNKKNRHYRGRVAGDFGKAKFSNDFEDVTVAIIAGMKPELDELADRFNVPRLRGFKTGKGNYGANQGDGVMQLNPNSFNRQSAGVLASRLSQTEKDQRLQEINQQFESITNQIEEGPRGLAVNL